MANAGPRTSGFADGSRTAVAGPRTSGSADGSRPYGAGPRVGSLTNALPPPWSLLPDAIFEPYSGRAFLQSAVTERRLRTIEEFDLATPGAINLYTVPAASECIITLVALRCETADTLTAVAEVKVGANVGQDDIYPPQPLLGFTSVGDRWVFPNRGGGVIAQAAQIVRMGIVTPATATEQLVDIDVYGYVF